jgi:hypothetical protein
MTPAKIASASGPPGSLSRPDWRPLGEFTADDLRLEQSYFLQRRRRHLRLVHGWGIVCGLNIVSTSNGNAWDFIVCPGYGIGPCGDEILVQSPVRFSLKDLLWTRPLDNRSDRAWIQIEACEDPAASQSAPDAECGCGYGGASARISHPANGVRITIAWTQPLEPRGEFELCSGATPPCTACPETCGLTLASVLVPPSGADGN